MVNFPFVAGEVQLIDWDLLGTSVELVDLAVVFAWDPFQILEGG